MPLAAATKAFTRATRRYANRKVAWFRKEPLVRWVSGFGDGPAIFAAAEKLLAGQMHSSATSGS
jgi:tRNA A37 N6-isopentenylltransferase MiaA